MLIIKTYKGETSNSGAYQGNVSTTLEIISNQINMKTMIIRFS